MFYSGIKQYIFLFIMEKISWEISKYFTLVVREDKKLAKAKWVVFSGKPCMYTYHIFCLFAQLSLLTNQLSVVDSPECTNRWCCKHRHQKCLFWPIEGQVTMASSQHKHKSWAEIAESWAGSRHFLTEYFLAWKMKYILMNWNIIGISLYHIYGAHWL